MKKYVVRASILLTILLFLSGCGNDSGQAVQTEENFLAEPLGAPFQIAVAVVKEVGPIEWGGTLSYIPPDGVEITAVKEIDSLIPTKTVVATFDDYSDGYTGYTITGVLTMVITNPTHKSTLIEIALNGTLSFTEGQISEITFNDVHTWILFGNPPTSATGTVTVDGTVYDANTIIDLFAG